MTLDFASTILRHMHVAIYTISGLLLAGIGLSAVYLEKSILTPAIIYLVIGVLLGPAAFGILDFDVRHHWPTVEYVTELVVVCSVFAAGLKMKPLLNQKKWLSPLKLASIGVIVAITLITGLGMLFGLSMPLALLVGAMMAPTDPVLASAVQVEHEDDKDPLRFSLTAEAGMNDGSAFPFLFLALGLMSYYDLGNGFLHWLSVDFAYSLLGAVVIGFLLARVSAAMLNHIRCSGKSRGILDEFFGLGLLGLVYGVSLLCGVYGFVAAFVAGVVFRRFEIASDGPSDEHSNDQSEKPQASAVEIITFNDNLEKVGEFVCIIVLGTCLSLHQFTVPNILFALAVMFVVRPLSVFLSFTNLNLRQKSLVAWFGVRGVGSLFYLAFAIHHISKLSDTRFLEPLINLVFVVITLSIFIHGASSAPLMKYYKRRYPKAAQ